MFSGLIGLFWLQAGHYQRPESAPPLVGLPDHEFNTLWEDDHLAHLPFHAPSGVLALPELPEEAARQSTKTAHASMVNIHANCSYEVRCIAPLQSAVCINTRKHSTSLSDLSCTFSRLGSILPAIHNSKNRMLGDNPMAPCWGRCLLLSPPISFP